MTTLRLGDTAPDFTQDSTEGTIHFHEWAGSSWVVLFSHPADFTPESAAVLPSSVVQTGVKSAGCENKTTHELPAHS